MTALVDWPAGLQTDCDAILDALDAALGPLEETYRSTRDGYWQGLATHEQVPEDGGEFEPDATRVPVGEETTWALLGVPLPAAMPLSVRVDVYSGPAGEGWILVGEVGVNSQIWRRCVGHGPELRTADWQIVAALSGGG